jgi:hypothetical protein
MITVSNIIVTPPILAGDGGEYFLMRNSLVNHFTPDLKKEDIKSFYKAKKINIFNREIDPYSGYYKAINGKYYSLHFWTYSLLNVPVKLGLEAMGIDSRKSFQFVNAFLIIVLYFFVSFFSNFTSFQKILFNMLIFLSPMTLFLHWPHPEMYGFVFVSLALLFLKNRGFTFQSSAPF